MAVIVVGDDVGSVTWSTEELENTNGLLVDNLGFYIISGDGFYIDIGGGHEQGDDPIDSTWSGVNYPSGTFVSGDNVATVTWSAGS